MTPEEIKSKIVSNLFPKYQASLDWAGLVSAVQTATAGEKDDIVNALKASNPDLAGRKLAKLAKRYLTTQAEAEADTIMADGSITLAEFERIYG